IRDKIAAVVVDAARQGAAALASAAAADDPQVSAGTIGKVTDFEVAGVKPFHFLTLGIANLIAGPLADDLIGEHVFVIPAANIADFSDQAKFSASVRKSPDLPFDVQLNWPPSLDEEMSEEELINESGTYKAYLLIRAAPAGPFPVIPGVS